jgi:hypothetical protein
MSSPYQAGCNFGGQSIAGRNEADLGWGIGRQSETRRAQKYNKRLLYKYMRDTNQADTKKRETPTHTAYIQHT